MLTHRREPDISTEGFTRPSADRTLTDRIKSACDLAQQKSWHQSNEPWDEFSKLLDNLPRFPCYFNDPTTPLKRDAAYQLECWFLSLIRTIEPLEGSHRGDFMFSAIDTIDTTFADSIRTRRFSLEIATATQKLLKSFDHLHVVDAGCGMIPILGVVAALQSKNVRVTFLEYNPDSAAYAKQIISALGIENQCEMIIADATSHKLIDPCHLLMSETMFTGLTNEPLVQIMENLAPYVVAGGRIIPERVIVKVGITPVDQEDMFFVSVDAHQKVIAAAGITWLSQFEYISGAPLPLLEFSIPLSRIGSLGKTHRIVVGSDVYLGKFDLTGYDSLLTIPRSVHDFTKHPLRLHPEDGTHGSIVISYEPGGVPVGEIVEASTNFPE